MDHFSNTYHHSINKKPINAGYSASTGNNESNPKPPKFKVKDKWELLSIRIYFVRFILKIGQEKYLLSILFWKLIIGHIKLKI